MTSGKGPYKVWEVNLLLTLRDMQWRHGAAYLGWLHGNESGAEQAFGDAVFSEEDRIMLLELKATNALCSLEVSENKPPVQAYRKTLGKLRTRNSQGAVRHSRLSMRCHHFVYWRDEKRASAARRVAGDVYLQPYLLRLCRLPSFSPEHKHEASALLGASSLGARISNADTTHKDVRFRRVFAGSAWMSFGQLGTTSSSVKEPLGLNANEFREFVKTFLEEQGNPQFELKALAYSPTCGLIRYILTNDELADFAAGLGKTPKPDPTKEGNVALPSSRTGKRPS